MPARDDVHFEDYAPQTKAKHRILEAYLPAYLTSLKNRVAAFHYIDAFAGRGKYSENAPGSPLLALDLITSAGVADRTSITLIEERRDFFDELNAELIKNERRLGLFDAPLLRLGRFECHIDEALGRPIYSTFSSVGTFAFVDPCGVDGVRMQDLTRLLSLPYGEVLLFFNYDGVNRLVGGAEKGTHGTNILVELFGTSESVDELLRTLASISDSKEREKVIRDAFVQSLIAQSHVKYVTPFRFQARGQNRTSHYIVHCCNSCLGFKMIKDVMWEVGREPEDEYGKLEFLNKSEVDSQLTLFQHFRPDIDAKKREIVDYIAQAPRQVATFTREWLCRPTDSFSEKAYKSILLDLERHEQVLVYDKHNKKACPAEIRRQVKGKATLGDQYWLRLR